MLNINLNLPTLPTQDEKDAMDGANLPSATNVFVTANDISTPTLQEVTDAGSTTTNTITVGDLATDFSQLLPTAIGTENAVSGTYAYLDSSGALGLNNGVVESNLKNTDVTNAGVILEFPDKPTGSYTIATIDDIPTPTMQVNSDWNATSGVAEILNKPTIPSVTGFVPYTGANNNLDLGTYNLTADHIALNTNPSGAGFVEGATQWNNTLGSSETTLKGGNVVLKNGVDLVARVVNKVTPSATLTKANYEAVKVSGATGQKLSVALAQANLDLNSADTIGLVCETIATNQEGFILTMGQLLEINTTGSLQGETWADGDVLYLSPTTAGKLTNIKPTGATGHIVVMGYVEYSHSIHGAIYVKIMNGWELDELHNVYINGVANKDLLTYESSTSLWKNKSASTLGIEETSNKSISVTTDQASNTKYPSVKSVYDWATGLFATITNLALKANIASPTFTGAVRVNDGTGSLIFRQATAIAADPCIFLFNDQVTAPSATNYILKVSSVGSGNTYLNGNAIALQTGGASRLTITNGYINIGNSASSSGALTSLQLNPSSNTNQTASTEQKSFEIATCTSQHATGALTTQRFAVINAPTYSFVGASTITTAATLAITASPIAGTNATITNSYALWIQGGKSLFAGNIELTQTVTTETVVSNKTVTIVINGTTYKLLAV